MNRAPRVESAPGGKLCTKLNTGVRDLPVKSVLLIIYLKRSSASADEASRDTLTHVDAVLPVALKPI